MAEMTFADGRHVVDDIYVGLLSEATQGHPERFTFREAMKRLGHVLEQRTFRGAIQDAVRGHFRQWPGS